MTDEDRDGIDDEHGNQAAADGPDERTHDPETVPLDVDDGPDVVIRQENVGVDQELGSGEFPDPGTPPQDPAPGG